MQRPLTPVFLPAARRGGWSRWLTLLLTTLGLTGALGWSTGGTGIAASAAVCAVPSGPHPTLQSAVDDPTCARVDLAAGVYTPTVTITRTLELVGAASDQAVLDGEGLRRPLTVLGDGITVTLRTLGIRQGNATHAAAAPALGGGLLISGTASVQLDAVVFTDNRAYDGGAGSGTGGALAVTHGGTLAAGQLVLVGNVANGGSGSGYGGGVAVLGGSAVITTSRFQDNRAGLDAAGTQQGGAVYLVDSSLTLARSILRGNHAKTGAAILAENGAAATGRVDATNSWIVANVGDQSLFFDQGNPALADSLRHVTLVGPGGSVGLQVAAGTTTLTNTIVASFTLGLNNAGGTIVDGYSLLADNGVDRAGVVDTGHPITGSPRFVDAAAGNYHLGEGSDAVDRGIDLGVVDDLDGDLRDAAPDVGADEFTEAPITGLTIQGAATVVVSRTLTLTAEISTGTGVSYTWDYGDGRGGVGRVVTPSFAALGVYTIVVTATNPIHVVTATHRVEVLPGPLTGAAATNDGPQVVGSPVVLRATVGGGTGITFTWEFGDGQVGSGITATHSYTRAGYYTATVAVANPTSVVTGTTQVLIGDAVVEVLESNVFRPARVRVPPGGWVVWVWRGGTHSVTADDGSFEQPRGRQWPPFVHRFDQIGLYGYHCDVHGDVGGVGMAGTVTVDGPTRLYVPSLRQVPSAWMDSPVP